MKREPVKVCGGDKENYWFFYAGERYEATKESIAEYALKNDLGFGGMSADEIIREHIFFGTEGPSYNGMYNGDTFVLFLDKERLPKDLRLDAK